MALFKIKKGLAANLPSATVEGYCYVTTDDKKFYIDLATADAANNSNRICLNAAYADSAGSANSVAWSNVTGKTDYTTRWPKWSEVTDKTTFSGGTTTLAWGQTHTIATVDGNAVKVTMPANPNTDHYAWADITGKPATATSWPTWDQVTGKPSAFTPASHTHSYAGSSSSGGAANSANILNAYASIGSSTTDHGVALKNWFTSNKSTAPRNKVISFYSATSGNGSQYMGYFLSGYEDTPYGGFFVCHYNNPYYVGIQSGTFTQQHILTSTNYTTYTVTKTGSGASGSWGISVTGSAGSVAWGNVTGKPSTFAPSSHTHSYVPLSGGTMTGQLYINLDQDVGLNQAGSLVIGTKAGQNLGFDCNEIMARNNSAASTLYINNEGGAVQIGSGGLNVASTITATAGLLKTTLNGNTVTIGSQNSGYCHIYNSANIPFIFNRGVHTTDIAGTLGNATYPFHALFLGGATNATMSSGSGNPRIVFQEAQGTQPVLLVYTDYDSYRSPAGLKVIGGASATPAWFEVEGHVYASAVHSAVWNDYAECRKSNINEPGRVIAPNDFGMSFQTTKRLMSGCRVISDTWGMLIGESEEAKTPVAVSGRVLVYPYRSINEYHAGDCVCSAPNGTVDIMTREEIKEYPDRIIGIVNEIPTYEIWTQIEPDGERKIKQIQVNGRIWIDVK